MELSPEIVNHVDFRHYEAMQRVLLQLREHFLNRQQNRNEQHQRLPFAWCQS